MFVTDPIGIKGEEEAAKMLEKKGFKVLEHNWRMGHWEIDLIAENKDTVVFAEVKARTTMYGDIRPEEYVDEDEFVSEAPSDDEEDDQGDDEYEDYDVDEAGDIEDDTITDLGEDL
jgi:putative endonuclease